VARSQDVGTAKASGRSPAASLAEPETADRRPPTSPIEPARLGNSAARAAGPGRKRPSPSRSEPEPSKPRNVGWKHRGPQLQSHPPLIWDIRADHTDLAVSAWPCPAWPSPIRTARAAAPDFDAGSDNVKRQTSKATRQAGKRPRGRDGSPEPGSHQPLHSPAPKTRHRAESATRSRHQSVRRRARPAAGHSAPKRPDHREDRPRPVRRHHPENRDQPMATSPRTGRTSRSARVAPSGPAGRPQTGAAAVLIGAGRRCWW